MKPSYLLAVLSALVVFASAGCDTAADTENDEPPTEQTEDEATDEEVEAKDDSAADETLFEPLDEETREAALVDPSVVDDQAPETFEVEFETTQGDFTVAFHRDWAPHGVDRIFNLVRIGYYQDVALFRVIDGFMAQFGIHGEPEVNEAWRNAEIPDDEVTRSNTRGKVTFAMAGPDTRTTQLFINFADNSTLDDQGFSPVGEVVDGMDVVDSIYDGYGEGAPRGDGPDQGRLQQEGNDYLQQEFERLDYIEDASLVR